ncbi:hypothetical protein D3C71_1227560 [compost metagenome]
MPQREAFQLRPADPASGERAAVAAGLELGRGGKHFGPGLGRLVGVQAGLLEGILVVIEHRRGAVERVAQHLAIGRGVVASHSRHVLGGVELEAAVVQYLGDGHDGALAGHHGGGAHFKHLQDVGGVARTEGGDGACHGFVIRALVSGHDLVLGLAGVVLLGQVIDPVAQCCAHRMPPLNLNLLRLGLRRCADRQGNGSADRQMLRLHEYFLRG